MRKLLLAALATLAFAAVAHAEDQAAPNYQALLTPLLQSGTDVLSTPLHYPDGPVKVTAAIVTLPVGGETGWHLHEVPLYAYILEGELTVDYGTKGKKTYRAGDSVLEAIDWPHNGVNTGTVPMKLLAVYMGSETANNTVKQPAP